MANEDHRAEVEPGHSSRTPRCRNCRTASDNLLRCSACKSTPYCNKVCQRQDWKLHKKYCHMLKSADHTGLCYNDHIDPKLRKFFPKTSATFVHYVWANTDDVIKMEFVGGHNLVYRGKKHELHERVMTCMHDWRIQHLFMLDIVRCCVYEDEGLKEQGMDHTVIYCDYNPSTANKAAHFPVVKIELASERQMLQIADDAVTNMSKYYGDLINKKKRDNNNADISKAMLVKLNLGYHGLPDIVYLNYGDASNGFGRQPSGPVMTMKRTLAFLTLQRMTKEGSVMNKSGQIVPWTEETENIFP